MTDQKIERMEQAIDAMGGRVSSLETFVAVSAESKRHMDRRFDTIEKKQDESAKMLKWALMALGGVIIAAFGKFILEGGLSAERIKKLGKAPAAIERVYPDELSRLARGQPK